MRQILVMVRHDRAESRVDLMQLIGLGTDQLAQIVVDERCEVGREPRLVEGFHDVVRDKGDGRPGRRELLVSGKTQSQGQLELRALGHLHRKLGSAISRQADERFAILVGPRGKAGIFVAGDQPERFRCSAHHHAAVSVAIGANAVLQLGHVSLLACSACL